MADEKDQGGTTESGSKEDAPVSFTQEQLDAALEAKGKATTEAVWGQFQSQKDKEVAEIRTKADAAVKGYADLQAQDETTRLAAMTTEEKTAYFAEKTYRATQSVGSASPPGEAESRPSAATGAPDPKPGTPGISQTSDQASQLQGVIDKVAKAAGIDPKTLDLSGGAEGLIKSAILAGAENARTPEQKAADANAKLQADRDANQVAPGGGTGGNSSNRLTMNPIDLIKAGARDNFAGITKP